MECEHVEKIADDMKQVAKLLYSNPRIGKVTISVETLFGVSVSHLSEGDADSPELKILQAKEKLSNQGDNNAIRNYQRSTVYRPKSSTARSPKDLQKCLQQWAGKDEQREPSSTNSVGCSKENVPKSWV